MLKRDISVDGLRGFAILCMFYAHLVPYFTENGTQLFFVERVISSIAAPLFLFLVGYNFNSNQDKKRVVKRMNVILVIAAFIDLFIWHIFPFYSFDVLYLIGISLFFLFITRRLNTIKLVVLNLTVLIISILFHEFGFYSIKLYEPYLNENYQPFQVFYNFFINGWFPFFPWIVFPVFGLLAQKITFNTLKIRFFSTLLFLAVIPMLFFFDFKWRIFASEIFYPASGLYVSFALIYLFFIWTNKSLFSIKIFSFLVDLGKASLFLYILHLTVYSFLGNYIVQLIGNRFIGFILFLVCFWLITFLINRYKSNWRIYQKSEVFQMLFGK